LSEFDFLGEERMQGTFLEEKITCSQKLYNPPQKETQKAAGRRGGVLCREHRTRVY